MEKHRPITLLLTLLLAVLLPLSGIAQDEERSEQERLRQIRSELESRIADQPGLDENVQLSVSNVTIKEFVRGIADAHGLNVSVAPNIQGNIANNFTNARVKDVFVYLCKQYSLDIEFIGSIINFTPYQPPEPEPEPVVYQPPKVDYDKRTDFLSLDLKNDTIGEVVKEITKQSLKNVILAPEAKGEKVSVFIKNRPFENSLEKMAVANGLTVEKTSDNFFIVHKAEGEEQQVAQQQETRRGFRQGKGNQKQFNKKGQVFNMEVDDEGRLTVEAHKIPLVDVIDQVSQEMFKNYFIYSEPEGESNLYVENATYDEFLAYLLNGTEHTFKSRGDGVYLIGKRSQEKLRKTELIQLENRTIESVQEVIPTELKKDVTIKEFIELNGFVVSGSHPKIRELKAFLDQVDQVVPVVTIEVMIVDVQKNRSINTGIEAGVGDGPEESGGTVMGSNGASYQFDSESLNELLNTFNGFGVVNLGQVTPDFYVSIKALENQGVLNTRSTPQLSTMNGHEANMKIGQTEYYLEVQNNVVGTQNPQVVNTQTYKSINADLALTIKPVVTGDEQVSLDVQVEQSDFTSRISETAPPGSVTRNFDSRIRVKNGEMILLGGLEDNSKENSSSGLPLLARVPIIKWLFASQNRKKSESKLNIFIKPTILY